MNTKKLTKLLALYLPYILLGLVATNFGEAWRLAEGKELGERIMSMCSNNLNQYAKAANENGRVYAADMEDLRQRLDELIEIGRQILSRLAEL